MAIIDLSDKVGFERYIGANSLHWYGRNIWRSGHYFNITETYNQRQSMAGVRLAGISFVYSIETRAAELTDLKMNLVFTYQQDTYALKWLGHTEAKSLSMGSFNTVEFTFPSDSVLEIASLSFASFSAQTTFSDYEGNVVVAITIHSISGTLESDSVGINTISYGPELLSTGSWIAGAGWGLAS